MAGATPFEIRLGRLDLHFDSNLTVACTASVWLHQSECRTLPSSIRSFTAPATSSIGHLGVDTVLIEKTNGFDVEALQ